MNRHPNRLTAAAVLAAALLWGASQVLSLVNPFLSSGQPTADDTDRVQFLLDQGGSVGLEAKTYTVTRPLKFSRPGTALYGQGPEATVINYRPVGGTERTATDWALWFGRSDMDMTVPARKDNWPGLRLADLTIDGDGSAAPGGVEVWGATRYTVERVVVRRFRRGVGFHLHSGWIGSFRDCRALDCRYGVKATHPGPAGSQAFNSVGFAGGEYGPGCSVGVLVGEEGQAARTQPTVGTGLHFDRVCFEGAKRWGCWLVDGNGATFESCYWESNSKAPAGGLTGHLRLGNDGCWFHGCLVSGNDFLGGLGPDPLKGMCIYGDNVRHLSARHNRFDPFTRGVAGVKLRRSERHDCPLEPLNFFAAAVTRKVEGP